MSTQTLETSVESKQTVATPLVTLEILSRHHLTLREVTMKSPMFLFVVFLAGWSQSAMTQKAKVPRTSVPEIARLLGVRVGYNGQRALERTLGEGKRFISGHPNSRQMWRVRSPLSVIETDGFNLNKESYFLDYLYWFMGKEEKSIPFAKRLPRKSGWLGTISLGATKRQVERLTHKILPPPKKQDDTWTWKAKGFVSSGQRHEENYRFWTATLNFWQGHLVSICLSASDGRD